MQGSTARKKRGVREAVRASGEATKHGMMQMIDPAPRQGWWFAEMSSAKRPSNAL